MSWDRFLERIANGEDVQSVLDEKSLIDRERIRSFLADHGEKGIKILREYDAAMKDISLGITEAKATWHSISKAARRVLLRLEGTPGQALCRRDEHSSVYVIEGGTEAVCKLPTLRNLCLRDLMEWRGGAFDPEKAAVLTEKAIFVLKHGKN